MDERFLQAWFHNREFRLLGRRLRPFCLAHRIALTALRSPLLLGDANPTLADIFIAARVCSAADPLDPASYRSAPSCADAWRFRLLRRRPARMARAAACWAAYYEEYAAAWPVIMADDSHNPEPFESIPWMLNVALTLQARGGCSEREAWQMPESRAIWIYVALARASGANISVLGSQEEEADRHMLRNMQQLRP